MQLSEILNFVQISPLIATSGQPQEKEFSIIADAGYITVINLARHDSDAAIRHEASIVAELDMVYHQIPVRFDRPEKKQVLHFILLMKMYEFDKVWVHCALNFRVSAFIYQYLIQVCGYSSNKARSPIFDFWQPDTVWQEVLQWSAEDIGLRVY